MKTTKLFFLIALALISIQYSCTKEETPSPYAEIEGTFSGDIAVTGDKTLAGTTNVTAKVNGENIDFSFSYGDYAIDFSAKVTELQADKDIICQVLQQDIMVNGDQVSIVGHQVSANYPSIHGTFSDANKTLTFSFTYTSSTETLVFYFVGDKQ